MFGKRSHICSQILGMLLVTGIYLPLSGTTIAAANEIQLKENEQVSWADVLNRLFKRKKPPLGSRGEVCALTPRQPGETGIIEIWSDRPLFSWQGEVERIILLQNGNNNFFWSQAVNKADRSIQYPGEALQPGGSYQGILLPVDANLPPIRIQFKVIAAKERQAIARELTQLEATLKPQGATAEMIALYQANYLASRQLGFDALQFALNVQNPSPELTQVIQTIPQRACPFPRYQQPPTG